MKKIISLILFLISTGIFFWYSSYTKQWPFDYHIAQYVVYLLDWSITLFIVSLFAWILNNEKYKIWLLVTGIYIAISLLLAYVTGSGTDTIINIDGKLLTLYFVELYSIISIIYFIVLLIKTRKVS